MVPSFLTPAPRPAVGFPPSNGSCKLARDPIAARQQPRIGWAAPSIHAVSPATNRTRLLPPGVHSYSYSSRAAVPWPLFPFPLALAAPTGPKEPRGSHAPSPSLCRKEGWADASPLPEQEQCVTWARRSGPAVRARPH